MGVIYKIFFVARRGARLLDEVERSGTRRLQTARAWPRAAQQKISKKALIFTKTLSHKKALCNTGRAVSLACAAAADCLRP